jgi:alpha/beta superfamily hydrolase
MMTRYKFVPQCKFMVSWGMPQLLHRNLFLPGPAGRLEAILWAVPQPPLAAVLCHPHPLFGGTMHNKVVYQTAKTIHRSGLPVLRFNFRGAGLSEGTHDEGRGEQGDVLAALDFLAAEYPGAPLLLAGFSFGSWVGLRVGCGDTRVSELIGLGLPVGDLIGDRQFSYLDGCGKLKLLVNGEFDQYGPPEKLKAMVGKLPPHVQERTSVAIISGADHFFAGHLPELDQAIAAWLKAQHPDLVEQRE